MCMCLYYTFIQDNASLSVQMKVLHEEKSKRKHAASVIKSQIKYTNEMKLESVATAHHFKNDI